MNRLEQKTKKLENILQKMGKVLIAFSGGVDSTLLVYMAKKILGGANILAVTAVSETYSSTELKDAKQLADSIGVRHIIINTRELENKKFSANSPRRCYFCKKELFSKLIRLAGKKQFDQIADAANVDDNQDYRPGLEAAKELGVRHPLQEAGFGKKDIRELSRRYALVTWDKPSLACLASRIPYGTRIERQNLSRINRAEEFLRKLKLKQVRVRDYENLARIEVESEDFVRVIKNQRKIVGKFGELGYLYTTLDLAGFMSGSMNKVLEKK